MKNSCFGIFIKTLNKNNKNKNVVSKFVYITKKRLIGKKSCFSKCSKIVRLDFKILVKIGIKITVFTEI